jgi:hypothetical protein
LAHPGNLASQELDGTLAAVAAPEASSVIGPSYSGRDMSFLDNLESNLKSLESAEEGRESAHRQRRAREQELANAQAVAPWAEELKKSPFTAELLKQAARVGHSMRIKVYIAWLGSVLRLEASGRRLELRPTANG